jgi:hypothetical protein
MPTTWSNCWQWSDFNTYITFYGLYLIHTYIAVKSTQYKSTRNDT